jgi:hypothetical protein
LADERSNQEVFKLGYAEVLAALKHQDEKINRTLTALAFLTAAGVALYTQLRPKAQDPPATPLQFDHAGPEIPAVMFVIFLVAVAFALLTALAAIGPSGRLRFGDPDDPVPEDKRSLLYHTSIARGGSQKWDEYLTWKPENLEDKLAKNLHRETRLLARRIEYKMARARESGAFVQIAILALALLGIFQASGLSASTRWCIAAWFLALALLVPFWELGAMCVHRLDRPWERRWFLAYLVLAFPVGMGIVMLFFAPHRHWEALGYALFTVLLSRFAAVWREAAVGLLLVATAGGAILLYVMYR